MICGTVSDLTIHLSKVCKQISNGNKVQSVIWEKQKIYWWFQMLQIYRVQRTNFEVKLKQIVGFNLTQMYIMNFTWWTLGWNNLLNSLAEVKGSPKYSPNILADLALA